MLKNIVFCGALLILSSNVVAADRAVSIDRGKLLYENHCGVCHTSLVHQRSAKKAKSREDILSWVIRWHNHLKLDWSLNEALDVVGYLDQQYYHFEN